MKIAPNMARFKIKTENGYSDFNGVSRVKLTDADAVEVTFNNTETHVFTLDHMIYTDFWKVKAGNLTVGYKVNSQTTVTKIKNTKYTGYVYDVISVENPRSNFIIGNKVKVNSSNCVTGSSKTKYRNRVTGEIVELTMEELKIELLKCRKYP